MQACDESGNVQRERDETCVYIDVRYVCVSEAFGRLMGWPAHRVSHLYNFAAFWIHLTRDRSIPLSCSCRFILKGNITSFSKGVTHQMFPKFKTLISLHFSKQMTNILRCTLSIIQSSPPNSPGIARGSIGTLAKKATPLDG